MKTFLLAAAVIFLALSGCSSLSQADRGDGVKKDSLKIGWASADISTAAPVPIGGQMYTRISKGVKDPITATALWIDNGKDSVCFVSLDMLLGTKGIQDGVFALLKKRDPEIPLDKIIISVTHTHAAPDITPEKALVSLDEYSGDLFQAPTSIKFTESSEYCKFLFEKIAGIICEAYKNRKNGGIAYGYGDAAVGYNRRSVYKDDVSKRKGSGNDSLHGVHGHAVLFGNPDDEMFAGFEGAADPTVNFLFTFDENNKLTGAVINSSSPAQDSSRLNKLSADYWHETREMIRAKYGNIHILPQCGAAGDIAPWQLLNNKAKFRRNLLKYGRVKELFQNELQRIQAAEKIFAAFEEVYPWAKNEIITAADIRHEVKHLDLPIRNLMPADYEDAVANLKKLEKVPFVKEGDDPEAALKTNSLLVTSRRRYRGIIERWNMQQKKEPFKTQIHVLCIGDIAFASNTFELYQDFQTQIQGRSPFVQTFLIQLSSHNGLHGGYLATKRSVENKGYGSDRFSNRVDWKGGDVIVDETVKILKKFWKEKSPSVFPSRKTAGIVLDGSLDDADWKNAVAVNTFIAATGCKPQKETVVKVLHDDKFIYVGITAFTTDIKEGFTYCEKLKKRDASVWNDDSCEIILGKKSAGGYKVFNWYGISTAGVLFDAQRGHGMNTDHKFSSAIRYKIKKYPSYYTMEIAVPASDFGQNTFSANDIFKINIRRACHYLGSEYVTVDGIALWNYNDYRSLLLDGK